MKADVDVIICTRNNREIISATLKALEGQTVRPNACTVVDGNSADGTRELIYSNFPWVKIIRKEEDSGPAASRNIGLKGCSGDYVIFLDSDVVLMPDWIEQQVAFLNSSKSTALACGKLLDSSQPDLLDAAYCAMNRYGVVWNGGLGQPADSFRMPKRCVSCTSSAMIARKEAMDRIGEFDEVMFACHEDSDLCWRANILGYTVFFNPAAVGVHRKHGTMNACTMGDNIRSLLWRNRLRSNLVNYELSSLLRYGSVFVLFSILDAIAFSPRRPKLWGLAWNVTHLRDTLRRRRIVQLQRRLRDRDLWFLFESGLRGPGRFYA
jgi:GT2 family glycosyltransferase